jgi:hypothetical protein
MLSLFRRRTPCNRAAVLELADRIERAADPGARPELGFSMASFYNRASGRATDMTGHGCETVACIEGWAYALGLDLGLGEEAKEALFFPPGWDSGKITVAQAVDTLRRLAGSGRIEWRR